MSRIPSLLATALVLTSGAARAQQPSPPAEPLPAPAAPITDTVPPATEPLPPVAEPLSPVVAPLPPEEPKLIDRLGVGKFGGYFQPSALFQVWGFVSKVDGSPVDSTFRLRRAEFRAKGEIVPKHVSYYLAFDVAKTTPFQSTTVDVGGGSTVTVQQPGADRSPLQDIWITYISDYADVSAGQFKIPVSLEALQSSARLLFPERARVSRQYGDRRDVGIRIEKKIGDYIYYQAGVYNGAGQNVTDNDREKDVGLRLELYPIKPLTIGGVGYTTVGDRDQNARDRVEADLRWDGAGLFVQAEYIHGWDGNPTPAGRREGHGAYGEIGYTIADLLQPVARIGFVDANIDAEDAPADSRLTHYELGLNYLVQAYEARLSLGAAYFSQRNGLDTTEITLQSQVAF
jgi:phosphate-selective porin O/P